MTSEIPNCRPQRKARKANHLFDKLDHEFRRLAAEWEPEPPVQEKYRKEDHIISDTSFGLDLEKAVAAINALSTSLDGYWDERILRNGRTCVVQEHPVITQLKALSDALSTLKGGFIPPGVPQELKRLGNRLSENQLRFLKNLYLAATLIEQNETNYRNARPIKLPDCDLKEACNILADKLALEFKGAEMNGKRLYKLIYRHRDRLEKL